MYCWHSPENTRPDIPLSHVGTYLTCLELNNLLKILCNNLLSHAHEALIKGAIACHVKGKRNNKQELTQTAVKIDL